MLGDTTAAAELLTSRDLETSTSVKRKNNKTD